MTAERSWIFGQGADCDVRVQDEYVSTRHCKVTLRPDGVVTVEDLGSTNGTLARPVSAPASVVICGLSLTFGLRIYGPTPIPPGWIIRIGRTDIPPTVPS